MSLYQWVTTRNSLETFFQSIVGLRKGDWSDQVGKQQKQIEKCLYHIVARELKTATHKQFIDTYLDVISTMWQGAPAPNTVSPVH